MKRRTFIKSTAAGTTGLISGCINDLAQANDENTIATTGDEPQREISVVEYDELNDYDFNIEVEALSKHVNTESTAKFNVTKTNSGNRRYVQIPQCGLFNADHGGSKPRGLWLYDVGNIPYYVQENKKGNKWTVENNDSVPTDRSWGDGACSAEIYEKDESKSRKYEIWDDHLVDGYFPTGDFRFEADISIWESDNTKETERSVETWGFSIMVV